MTEIVKGDYVHVHGYDVYGWVNLIDRDGYALVNFGNSGGNLSVKKDSLSVVPRERATPHNIALGTIVETEVYEKLYRTTPEGEECAGILSGAVKYVVVERYRDVDGTPMYNLALDPVEPPLDPLERVEFFAFPNLMGLREEDLAPISATPLELLRR